MKQKHLSIYCTDLRKSKCSIRFIKFILSLTHFPENTLIHIDENTSQTKEDKTMNKNLMVKSETMVGWQDIQYCSILYKCT